jgi:hypothetical protein
MLLWKVEANLSYPFGKAMKKILLLSSLVLLLSVGSLVLLIGGALIGNPLMIGAGIAAVCLCCAGVVGTTRAHQD